MSPVRQPDECGGGDLPHVRDTAIEPGPLAARWRESGTEHVAPRRPEHEIVAKAEAITDMVGWEQRGTYADYLRSVAGAWTEVFHTPVTPERAAVAIATLELLRKNQLGL